VGNTVRFVRFNIVWLVYI